jgi:acyl-CoA synthetase (NDP forming)
VPASDLEPGTGQRLTPLFRPRSIAVVGASPKNPWNLQMLENVRAMGFDGRLSAVHPNYSEVGGEPCYPDLRSVPEPPDAILVAVGRARVVGVIEQAAEIGVPAAVIVADGFAEKDAEGRDLQRRLQDVASVAGMAVVGPNCQGVLNVAHGSALYLDRIHERLNPGHVGLISQSGTLTTALVNNARGVTFSFVASTGNEAVVEAADVLEFLVTDPNTRVIAAFLETIRSPERFFALCDDARASGKPVIVLKAGRTEAASAAALAHTGALAAPYRQVEARLRRAGVLSVGSLEELLETAVAVSGRRRLGKRIAAVTLSGGQAELMLDTVEGLHLEFAQPAPATMSKIQALGLRAANPLDAWGSDDFDASFPLCIDAFRDDPGIDTVVALVEATARYPTGHPELAAQVAAAVERSQSGTDKQMVVLTTLSGNVDPELQERLAHGGIPLLSGLRQALVALDRAALLGEHEADRPLVPHAATGDPASRLLDVPFSGLEALDVLREAGLDVVDTRAAADEDDAVRAASELGYPVVLKTADPTVLHKTELGAVSVGLRSEEDMRASARRITERLPGTTLLVQPQISGGLEMILGLQSDPELGSFVLLGLGGVWAEIFDDVSMRALPLRRGEAAEMLDELRASPLLDGARGAEALDRVALVRAIERLAALGVALDGAFESIDVNPLFVFPHGAVAVDAVVVVGRL